MKHKSTSVLLLLVILLSACVPDRNPSDIPVQASSPGASSHNSGQECFNAGCHDGSPNSGLRYSIAGSIYQENRFTPHSNAAVQIYSEPYGGGTRLLSLDVDLDGNFYTNESFTEGFETFYPVVVDRSTNPDTIIYKPAGVSPINQLQTKNCNDCHNNIQSPYINTGLFSNKFRSSHNAGTNCFSGCHNGVNGRLFSAAGTAYFIGGSSFYLTPNNGVATIAYYRPYIYSNPDDPLDPLIGKTEYELVGASEIDFNGNFYRTNPLPSTYHPQIGRFNLVDPEQFAVDPTMTRITDTLNPEYPGMDISTIHPGISSPDCGGCHGVSRTNIQVP